MHEWVIGDVHWNIVFQKALLFSNVETNYQMDVQIKLQ